MNETGNVSGGRMSLDFLCGSGVWSERLLCERRMCLSCRLLWYRVVLYCSLYSESILIECLGNINTTGSSCATAPSMSATVIRVRGSSEDSDATETSDPSIYFNTTKFSATVGDVLAVAVSVPTAVQNSLATLASSVSSSSPPQLSMMVTLERAALCISASSASCLTVAFIGSIPIQSLPANVTWVCPSLIVHWINVSATVSTADDTGRSAVGVGLLCARVAEL